jgi:hypothetical protein
MIVLGGVDSFSRWDSFITYLLVVVPAISSSGSELVIAQ